MSEQKIKINKDQLDNYLVSGFSLSTSYAIDSFDAHNAGFLRSDIGSNGYLIHTVFPDDRQTWKTDYDTRVNYRFNGHLTFGMALDLIKLGIPVSRSGENWILRLENSMLWQIYTSEEGGEVKTLYAIKTVDALAEDWKIVE